MKLLLLSVKSDTPTGGIAVWTDHFLKHCQEQDIECHLVNTEIPPKRNLTGKRNILDEIIRSIRIFSHLHKELKANDFDIVYLNTSCGTYGLFRDTAAARMVRKKNIPLVTHYHCEIPYWVKRKSSILCLGRLVKMSNQNFVLCENSKKFIHNHYNAAAHKVPNFINSSIIRSSPKPISDTIERIVFVGNLSESKGATELYALARLFPEISFSFVGKISDPVALWPRPANVTLTGTASQEQVLSFLDESDLFLFPSHTEGCSIALMEAMARGLPAIATDTGTNAEMINNICGIIVPLRNTDAMATAIQQLYDPAIRKKMSAAAISYIAQHHTEKNIDSLFSLIQLK